MRLFKIFYNAIYFPFALGRKYPVNPYKIYKNILLSQFYKREEIGKYQDEKINEILKHAKKNTPYYDKIIKTEINYNRVSLHDIPELTKEDIKFNASKLVLGKTEGNYTHTTSGSSGDPLEIIADGFSESHRTAHRLRFYKWWGLKPTDRNVLIWGTTEMEQTKKDSFIKSLKKRLFNKTLFINVFELNKSTIDTYFKKIRKFNPAYIRGYKSAIYNLSLLLDKSNIDTSSLSLKAVITTSEVLFQEEREYIERILGAKVADEYGAAEIGLFSIECPKGGRHICEELNYIYTNDFNEVLVTDLHNKAMPLINYKIGDRIQIDDKTCACGRTSRLIKQIEGRLNSDILKEDGEFISQYLFYYAVKDLNDIGFSNSILKYKVIQDKMHFDFYIIKGDNFSIEVEKFLINRMRKDIGKNISVEFHYVIEIPLDSSGKLQFFKRIN